VADIFKVERSTVIEAPPETVFPFINDFHQWALWSPWEKIDADLAKTFSGAEAGPGAVYEWSGKKTGAGRMEITAATPSTMIKIDLQFLRPFKQRNQTEFSLRPSGTGAEVTWTMTGAHNLMSKLMGLVVSMDKMVGKDFATGLANLKSTCEAAAKA
jgi:uncharacterized protein YndB with AHSA1/START domain